MRRVFDEHDFGMNIRDSPLEKVLNSKFKNTFETGSSGGYLGGGSSTKGRIPVTHGRLGAAHYLFGLPEDLKCSQLKRAG